MLIGSLQSDALPGTRFQGLGALFELIAASLTASVELARRGLGGGSTIQGTASAAGSDVWEVTATEDGDDATSPDHDTPNPNGEVLTAFFSTELPRVFLAWA